VQELLIMSAKPVLSNLLAFGPPLLLLSHLSHRSIIYTYQQNWGIVLVRYHIYQIKKR